MRILAIDPGMMNGWARWEDDDLTDYGEMDHEEFATDVFQSLTLLGPWDAVVCEDYLITIQTLKKTRQLYSLHLIGFFKYLCRIMDIPFILQTPAEAKSFSTNDKLKALGWYFPTPDGHQNDAIRHLMLYLVNEKQIPLGRFLNGAG